MANVKYFEGFNNLNDWPGNLLENREGDSTLTTQTATNITITHGPNHPFAGFKIVFVGTGFAFDGSDVVDGVLSSVTFRDASNAIILQITGISSLLASSDITSILPLIMGWSDPGNPNLNTEAKAAWSQLLMGNDVITGTIGDDRSLIGVDGGNDRYNMGAGNDWISGGIGNDIYNGEDGFDTLSFTETNFNEGITATRGINVNMATGVVKDAFGGTDTINSIEYVIGTRFKDVFVGSDGRDEFSGGRGADSFDGGLQSDWVRYDEDVWAGGTRGINANLATGFIIDGFGTRDTVVNIERVAGTRFNDTFVGDGGRNMFAGGEGVDSYDGGANLTNSVYDGDVINFGRTFMGNHLNGVNINLSLASNQIANDGFGNVETAIRIEGALGTDFDDTMRGNGFKNLFAGGDGKDTMTGGGSNDVFEFWSQDHAGDGDLITDFSVTLDLLSFDAAGYNNMTTTAIVENDMNADTTAGTFLFNTTTKILYWDENGSGAGGQFEIVKLNGVAGLTASNFELSF